MGDLSSRGSLSCLVELEQRTPVSVSIGGLVMISKLVSILAFYLVLVINSLGSGV